MLRITIIGGRNGSDDLDRLVIGNSPPLRGRVRIEGAKNAMLPIMAATLLTEDVCTISDIPSLGDVGVMQQILEHLGVDIGQGTGDSMRLSASRLIGHEAPYELANAIRGSFLIAGALLARQGKARIPLPGGCAIGARPIELHLKGFSAMGADITKEHGFINLSGVLSGAKIYLDFPSVGATENIIMAACLANGRTIIENCAVEPEIVDLANFINSMGAEVRGAGTDTIKINGVKQLSGTHHSLIPDRIEAGTFMVAAAVTHGDILLENAVADHLKPIIAKLEEAGAKVEAKDEGLRTYVPQGAVLRGIDIKTLPYPGFPTDMQAQFMAMLAVAQGTSVVTETVFENRYLHVGELKRMGANIKIEGRSAVIEGSTSLQGASVQATDLRAAAAMVLAGLVAEGTTTMESVHHLERGYSGFIDKLKTLGANLEMT